MEHNRKQKLFIIIALVVGIASLSIGFAAFSATLNISSSASVTPSSDTFKVKFSINKDSLAVGPVVPLVSSYDATFTEGIIDNSGQPKISNLSATFLYPGQSVTFRVFARNEGEYNAYLNSVNFIGNKTCVAEPGTTESLVQNACDFLKLSVVVDDITYTETTSITGHVLEKNAFESINIILKYSSDGSYADGPFSVTFPDVALVYSTIDDSSMQPSVSKVVKLESGDLNTPGSIVSIGNEQFYVFGQEDGKVKLLSMYNLHVGNSVDDSWTVTPLESPTGIQDEDAIGCNFDSLNKVEKYPWIGTTAFSSDSQKGTNYSDYNGSIVEGYVNNYASYLENLGANIEESRLITIEELESLGCSSNDWICSGAPEFVYKTSYWSGSANDTDYVWYIDILENFRTSTSNSDFVFGVRPVIEISVSEF